MSDFWDKHSDRYLEMAFRTDRYEIVSQPDGYGKNTGECGDTIEMFLTLDTDRIKWVAFDTDRSAAINTRACANTVAEMVEKKTLEAAWKVTAGRCDCLSGNIAGKIPPLRGTGGGRPLPRP
ncbi:MAG: iron-sulfur cluster assembly scaffold protein [Desulfobacterales bacterium]